MNDIEGLFFEADKLLVDNKIIEGRDLLLEILMDYPDYGRAHNHLGWIYHYKLVDFVKAQKHYKLALKYEKNYYSTYTNYAYFLTDIKSYDAMLKFGEDTLKINGVDKGIIYNQMARAYELKFKLKEAYRYYKTAKMHSTAGNYIEEINASLQRIQGKMNFFQKISIIFK
ncbi:tetratricopeptide repeat protein [Winogradskyella thalassocola]|uniref:Tetratricopeptide repeat-containing protein n=1 Tax=Winogradskyella thalassocola TaxID=262004 RepID=A0A1G8IQQ6_9FLAO|nr:hypothetical protein [Winogradskyella thalassocola]SDI21193.1 hypothetical protein SAMN04489796_10845 [Winogradskyella thalassocola]